MGCGIALFGRSGLKTTKTWKLWPQDLRHDEAEKVYIKNVEDEEMRGFPWRGIALVPAVAHFDTELCQLSTQGGVPPNSLPL